MLAAEYSFTFSAVHVPGIDNGKADALSRFNWQAFRKLAPAADKLPVVISPHVIVKLSLVV
jgi:hypothetical protein